MGPRALITLGRAVTLYEISGNFLVAEEALAALPDLKGKAVTL